MLLVRILFFGSDFPLIKQGSAPVKIQKRENFSLLFVQRVDKVLNFLYNKGGKDRKLHKLCRRYAVCFRYFCDVSYPQLRELKVSEFPQLCKALSHVSYPQLRELKAVVNNIIFVPGKCILPAAAGIESCSCTAHNRQSQCILPAAAGIESFMPGSARRAARMYLTRSCGN